jgi:hypothetical protein
MCEISAKISQLQDIFTLVSIMSIWEKQYATLIGCILQFVSDFQHVQKDGRYGLITVN